MMMKFRIFILLVAFMLPIMASAQEQDDTVDFDAYLTELNAKCPIVYNDDWAINSLTTSGDSVILEIKVPAVLEAYLPLLSGDSDGVKKLWINQMKLYGEQWDKLVDIIVRAKRSFVLSLLPDGGDTPYTIVFNPSDFSD